MAVSNTDVALRQQIGNACRVSETTNISLGSLSSGASVGGINHTYAAQLSGPINAFEKFGGSNNPLQSTPNTALTTSDIQAISNTPHHMSHAIGGFHEDGGPGR